jgi:hypothetical protein
MDELVGGHIYVVNFTLRENEAFRRCWSEEGEFGSAGVFPTVVGLQSRQEPGQDVPTGTDRMPIRFPNLDFRLPSGYPVGPWVFGLVLDTQWRRSP